MDDKQKMFHDFVMNLVQPGKEEEAEAILTESFGKQDEGTMESANVEDVINQLTPLLRPEGVQDLEKAAAGFKAEQGHEDDTTFDDELLEVTTRLPRPESMEDLSAGA